MARTASGGARGLRRFVITVIVVLALLVVLDRGGDYVAQRVAGDTIQSSQHLPSRPSVAINGFPFLNQFAAGKYDEIVVNASDVPVGTDAVSLRLARVRLTLHQLTVSRDFSTFHADTGSADALVAYGDLGRVLGVGLSFAGNGRVKATKSVTVLGNTVSGSISAQPKIVNGALSFGSTAVNGLGQLGAEVSAALNKIFATSIPLSGIPFQVKVQSLNVDAAGVHLQLTGSNLSYAK